MANSNTMETANKYVQGTITLAIKYSYLNNKHYDAGKKLEHNPGYAVTDA